MAKVNVRHEFDLGAVHYFMQDRRGGVAQDMYRRGQDVRSAAIQLAGGDTGRLRASITVDLVPVGGTLAARVGTNVNYAGYHHEGHGVIVPRRPDGVLAFRPKGGGAVVFTKRVRPVAGTEFIRRALSAAGPIKHVGSVRVQPPLSGSLGSPGPGYPERPADFRLRISVKPEAGGVRVHFSTRRK